MRRSELSRRMIAALFVPLFAANLALLTAIGAACDSCKLRPVRFSQCDPGMSCSPLR